MSHSTGTLRAGVVCLLMMVAPILALSNEAAQERLAFVNGTVFDASGELVEGVTVTVRGSTIESVTRNGTPPTGARTIDATGMTILPGLIDSHVHLYFDLEDGQMNFPTSDADEERYFNSRLREKLEDALAAGFTSLVMPVDFWPHIVRARGRLREEEFQGPRLWVAGGTFVAPGGHYVCAGLQESDDREWCDRHASMPVGTVSEARAGVQQYAESGVDLIAYDAATNVDALQASLPTALVEEASKHDLPVFLHGSRMEDVKLLVDAGVSGFLHPPRVPSDGAFRDQVASLSGLPLGVSTGRLEISIREGRASEEQVRGYENSRAMLTAAFEAGAIPLFASDNVGAPAAAVRRNSMESLVRVGLSNTDILLAATQNPARHVIGDAGFGTVSSGTPADLLVVQGNPVDDLSALDDVRLVVVDGVIVVDRRN